MIYKDKRVVNPVSGSWAMTALRFTRSVQLPVWTFLWLSLKGKPDPWGGDLNKLHVTMKEFQDRLKDVGIDAQNFAPDPLIGGSRIVLTGPSTSYEAQINTILARFASNPASKPVLLVILPENNAATYNAVKRGCDIRYGLQNVCVIASKFAGKKDEPITKNWSYYVNVALKFNLKLGGQNQHLDKSKYGIIAEGNTMVVGIDVTHPSPGSAKNAPSVAGVVASIDRYLGQWPAALLVQQARKEMVEGLADMLKSRLKLWVKWNQRLPENILIYRDGVSEGQYQTVLDEELPLLRKACAETYPADSTKEGLPRMSIVIVGKRHHTRFYPAKEADADKFSNPKNGTVVDRGVTEARNWDFFLQAHTAIKGTARPAHYYVVLDEIFRYTQAEAPLQNAAESLQDLTHNLCYLFGRATKAVSVCPPAYYADLVCERARRYLSGYFDASSGGDGPAGNPASGVLNVHDNLKDKMFYI